MISRPLTNLLKKNAVFSWTEDKEHSLRALLKTLISAPVLALPDFAKEFEVETDASDKE